VRLLKTVVEASMAVARAVMLCKPKVIACYPITPQTHIVERLADFVNDGLLDAEMVPVESEHSALSCVLGASAAGVRTFTATASQGLALMYEILPIVSGLRLPVVMAVANRALSAPINIWNDHSDALSARDQGWMQFYVESSQEALDGIFFAYKISEHKDVLLPSMVCLDGFNLSHVWEVVDIPDAETVDKFLPQYNAAFKLDPDEPYTFGPIAFPDSFMEFKKMQQEAMENADALLSKINGEFRKTFGRDFGKIETYKLEDAEYAIVALGSICGTAKVAVDEMRRENKKVGLIKIRCFRPFPYKELKDVTKNISAIAAISRHISLGSQGVIASELKSCLGDSGINIKDYIAGLGGRDVTIKHFKKAVENIRKEGQEWLL